MKYFTKLSEDGNKVTVKKGFRGAHGATADAIREEVGMGGTSAYAKSDTVFVNNTAHRIKLQAGNSVKTKLVNNKKK